ncbi:coiled-coil and C2 domain-containing protein 1-like isoform X2 [Babylonia areolata]|uniref:coiled-coil and C2 domain-containing protein 1-like isoform X2 n=1 Tax=Babylonia areolata TaxID=304850 RepID=UPI003FD0C6C0
MLEQKSNIGSEHDTKRKGTELMKQMGFGMPAGMEAMLSEDRKDLEVELAALTKNEMPSKESSPSKANQVSMSEVEKMAAQALQDPDEVVSDTEDPELLSELVELEKSGNGAEPATESETTDPESPKDTASRIHLSETSVEGTSQSAMEIKENGVKSSDETFELPPEPTDEESKKLFQAPEAPTTVPEALNQRLEKYKSSEESARQAGDSGRARRMGRIVKQYERAIKAYSSGEPVNFEDLPVPPEFSPIPTDSNPPSFQRPAKLPPITATTTTAAASSARMSSVMQQSNSHHRPDVDAASGTAVKARPLLKRGTSRQEYQLEFLQNRRDEFRNAALNAKRCGDLDTAKQHLCTMKGIEQMTEALKAGESVDLSQFGFGVPVLQSTDCSYLALHLQVPPSPTDSDHKDRHIVVSADEFTPSADRDTLFAQLEQDIIGQMRMCATNSQHFTSIGDEPAASKCNTDLGDGEMELMVVRGIGLSLPSGYSEKDMDTTVKYEFLFPSDDPQTGQTSTVKSTVNPEYGESFKLQIDRKSRSFTRFVERKGIKLNVFIKRGFFKADQLLGSAAVKLWPLDSNCTLHDSFDLADGRKSVGGKLEVKVRIREPLKGRQVAQSQEKWLVIDQFIHSLGSKLQKTKSTKSSISTLS